MRRHAVIDFETFPAVPRPEYPPVPVSVAVRIKGRARYFAWGHPAGGNNSTRGEAVAYLEKLWKDDDLDLIFQNAKFDLAVAEERLDLPPPRWDRIQDTLPLLFLRDPHAKSYSLKPSSEAILDMPPEEQDEVHEWLIQHQPLKASGIRITEKNAGAYVAYAPGDLVGRYAVGDVVRTDRLYRKVGKEIRARGMVEAYDRERRLLPILMKSEREGVRVSLPLLYRDCGRYTRAIDHIDAWLFEKLGRVFNVDSGKQLAAALINAKKASRASLGLTPGGEVATSKNAIMNGVKDQDLRNILAYRSAATAALKIINPWIITAAKTGGKIFTTWANVRRSKDRHTGGSGALGARTGRLSSSPNFQNIPNDWPDPFSERRQPRIGYLLPPLPKMRRYIIPYRQGEYLLDRDYNQQELRILAHFEEDSLWEAYQDDPWLDVHTHAQKEINELLGTNYPRKHIKNTGFGLLYGMGIGKLAADNGTSVEVAKQLRDGYLSRFEGIKDINGDLKDRARYNEPYRTWGGREYYCEPSKMIKGHMRNFSYKMLNTLIQGSAADCTKQAIINFSEIADKDERLQFLVHDEIIISSPRLHETMEKLRTAMESVDFSVPMVSEGYATKKSWSDFRPYDVKGERVGRW